MNHLPLAVLKICLYVFIPFTSLIPEHLTAQSIDPWKINASAIEPYGYYGVTVANGMIGIVSSPSARSPACKLHGKA